MLTTKSDRIRALTAYAPPPMFTTTSTGFDSFRPITESDLHLVLKYVYLNSCELDPLRPFIMSDILDDLAHFVVYLFNKSILECCIPPSQKRALVFP